MLEVKSTLRKWGRSLGIVIPTELVQREGLKENQSVSLLINKKSSVLQDTFGALSFKKSTQHMMKESDKDLYYE